MRKMLAMLLAVLLAAMPLAMAPAFAEGGAVEVVMEGETYSLTLDSVGVMDGRLAVALEGFGGPLRLDGDAPILPGQPVARYGEKAVDFTSVKVDTRGAWVFNFEADEMPDAIEMISYDADVAPVVIWTASDAEEEAEPTEAPEETEAPAETEAPEATAEPEEAETEAPETATPEPTPTEVVREETTPLMPGPVPGVISTKKATPRPNPTPETETTAEPTIEPTEKPTAEPTEEATAEPTAEPTEEAKAESTDEPTPEAAEEATPEVTEEPTPEPTEAAAEDPADAVLDALGEEIYRKAYDAMLSGEVVRKGSKGDAARGVQQMLVAFGQGISVDGDVGRKTISALNAVQEACGLEKTDSLDAAGYLELLTILRDKANS